MADGWKPPLNPARIQAIMNLLILVVAFSIMFSGTAFAYLDPGSGSILLQFLIGGVLAGLYVLKSYWTKLKKFFSGGASKEAKNKNNDESPL